MPRPRRKLGIAVTVPISTYQVMSCAVYVDYHDAILNQSEERDWLGEDSPMR